MTAICMSTQRGIEIAFGVRISRHFGIHLAPSSFKAPQRWTITHLPSGLRALPPQFADRALTLVDAVRISLALEESGIDWDFFSCEPAHIRNVPAIYQRLIFQEEIAYKERAGQGGKS